jgi:hypothetical protein
MEGEFAREVRLPAPVALFPPKVLNKKSGIDDRAGRWESGDK